jgi:hypothetical protein
MVDIGKKDLAKKIYTWDGIPIFQGVVGLTKLTFCASIIA